MTRSAEPGAPYFVGTPMLDRSSLFTIEGFEIGDSHRWQTGLQKGQTESTMFLVLFQLSTGQARNDEVCSIVISAESEARRSPAQHFGRIMRGVWAGSLRLWSRRVSLRNLQENPVAGESGPDAAGISRSAYATACWALSCPISPYLSRIKLSAEHTGRRAVLADQGRTGNSSRTSRAVI
jgi:hypothetical protein